jgi:segregation and condensation protein B
MEKEEKKLIEAALFISSRAMSLEEFRTLTGIGALGYLQSVIDELKKDYENRAIEIIEADGKYTMQVKNDYLKQVKQFAQDIEISKAALRTLAYISKNDGILKSTLVKKIGPKIYDDVRELVEAGFIKATKTGRTKKLTLTEKFKKYFIQEKSESKDENQTTLPDTPMVNEPGEGAENQESTETD